MLRSLTPRLASRDRTTQGAYPRAAAKRHAAARLGAITLTCTLLLAVCSPTSDTELLASAKQYLANNDRPAAFIQLKSALQQNLNSAEARFLLGKALYDTGDVVAAMVELRKALAKASSNASYRMRLAKLLIQSGDKLGARAELTQLIELGDKLADHAEVATLLMNL